MLRLLANSNVVSSGLVTLQYFRAAWAADLSACDADQAPGAAEIDVRKERLPLFGAILSRV